MKDKVYLINKLVSHFQSLQMKYSNENSEKLIKVLDFWLHDFFLLYDSNLKMPEKGTMDLVGYAINLEDRNYVVPNSIESRGIKLFLWRLISKTPIFVGILPGGSFTYFDKIRLNILYYKLVFLDLKIDLDLKEHFFSYCSEVLNRDVHFALVNCFPDFFFFTKTSVSGFPKIYKGSMINFFHYPWNKILYLDMSVFLKAYVHGGGYGEFIHDRHNEFETNISNEFYGWGLHDRNIIQNRFDVLKCTERNLERTAWISPVYVDNPISESYFSGYILMKNQSLLNQKGIISKITHQRKPIWIMHPRQLSKNVLFAHSILLSELSTKEVTQTLFVLDVPGHTFMYKAIYECIPFLLYFNSEWRKFFTPNYNSFLEKLHEIEVLFWWHEEEHFLKRINEIRFYDKSIFFEIRKHLEKLNAN